MEETIIIKETIIATIGNFVKSQTIALQIIKTPKTKKYLLIGGGTALVLVVGFLLFGNGKSLLNRLSSRLDFTNPCSEEKFYTTGTQLCNGYIAFNNGGTFGVGLGNSTQKYLYLPEAYTDFIFAIVVEELGFIPSILILALMFICAKVTFVSRFSCKK